MTGATAELVIAGGGPAGMMAGLLFARAGCTVTVLEKHADFFRDFRGDTVHPSTLELLSELSLIEEFLKRPHDEVRTLSGRIANEQITIAANGRTSALRDEARLPRKDLGAPIDVLWFRLPKEKTPTNETGGTFGAGTMVVQIDRGDYWQCAYVVPKGAADEIRAKGIHAF